MFIKIGDQDVELSTKLGIAVKLEKRFQQPITAISAKIGAAANTDELIDIILIAAGKPGDTDLKNAILENWDFSDVYSAANELLMHLMFAGTPEQINAKIDKYPTSDEAKNALRAALGIATPSNPSTGGDS